MIKETIIVNHLTKVFSKNKMSIVDLLTPNSINPKSLKSNQFTALNDVSFSAYEGELLGIIGLNGSGKTTLLRTLSGIYPPDLGNITINGKLAPLLQIGTGFHSEYAATENILMYGMLMGMSKSEIENKIDKIIEFAELEDHVDMQLKHYSSGMRSRLGFSTALEINPDILLVDEILSVGDASFREKSFKSFMSFKEQGKTILYTTHSLSLIPKLCDRVVLLDHGNLVLIGSPSDVLSEYKEIVEKNKK
jgi:ABC-type polysaccharide/polyol phosphate transport system ATPase subunit